MKSLDYIKSLELVATDIYLADDTNEENPVDVYFSHRDYMFYTIDKNEDIRVFEMLETLEMLNVYHKNEILIATLGKVPANGKVHARDVFLHGIFTREIKAKDFEIVYNSKLDTLEGQGRIIYNLKGFNKTLILDVINNYNKLFNLRLIDELLLNSELCTQEQREDLMAALLEYVITQRKDINVMTIVNQIEKDVEDCDVTSIYELIDKLMDNRDNHKILHDFLSED